MGLMAPEIMKKSVGDQMLTQGGEGTINNPTVI